MHENTHEPIVKFLITVADPILLAEHPAASKIKCFPQVRSADIFIVIVFRLNNEERWA